MKAIVLKSAFQTFSFTLLLTMPSLLIAAPLTHYEVQKLVSTEDAFGISVAVSGDTAVIGAVGTDNNRGSAYVYTRNRQGIWSEQAELRASDGAGGDIFGISVAISGNTVIVGAFGNDNQSGSAYIYTRTGQGTWIEQAKLAPGDANHGDLFGGSVAISGDTAVIGADGSSNFVTNGYASVYARDGSGVWTEQARFQADDGAYYFGNSVAISGDTVAVGAKYDFRWAFALADIFTRDAAGVWMRQDRLLTSAGGYFNQGGGSWLGISGDTAVLGTKDDDNGQNSGAAFVYARDAGGVWSQQAKLLASDGAPGHEFGRSVSISGERVVVKAAGNDGGAAYVYTRAGRPAWTEHAKLLPSDGAAGFGWSTAIGGNVALIGASGSAYLFDLVSSVAFLQCPGDINGDALADLAVLSGDNVTVKGLDGSSVSQFSLTESGNRIDTELVPDTNTNGAPELVALGRSPATAEVRDLLTGGDLGTVTFAADLAPVDLELTADRTGNGIPELAALAEDPMRLDVRDALTGTVVDDFGFARYLTGRDLTSYPDLNGDGAPELAVLADNRRPDGADKIEIRDVSTGAVVREIWLGWDWRVLEQELIADLNGNGSMEVAVLRVHPGGNVEVQIRDTVTREWLSFIGFAVKYPPRELVAIPDLDGNGADELVVFGRRFDGRNQKAVIKDSRTRAKLGELWFDPNFPGQDFVSCGDLNGNGSADLALLGRRARDGQIKVMVKDSKTGERLSNVWF